VTILRNIKDKQEYPFFALDRVVFLVTIIIQPQLKL
jgi:hypothetical protein